MLNGVVFVRASNPRYPILTRSQIELVNNRRVGIAHRTQSISDTEKLMETVVPQVLVA
jgi:hypothetical protein